MSNSAYPSINFDSDESLGWNDINEDTLRFLSTIKNESFLGVLASFQVSHK